MFLLFIYPLDYALIRYLKKKSVELNIVKRVNFDCTYIYHHIYHILYSLITQQQQYTMMTKPAMKSCKFFIVNVDV